MRGARIGSRRVRGFTLIELTVYMFLAMLFMLALGALFVSGRRMFESSSGSYMIGQETEAGIRFLRQDLQETALATLRVYPNANEPAQAPGCSMASARGYDNAGRFMVSRYGTPDWVKHVYYTLESSGDKTASLVRWERKDPTQSPVPKMADVLPSDGAKDASGSYKRVVIRNLLKPGVVVGAADGKPLFTADAEQGGFKVSFVRQHGADEELTVWNPTQVSAGDDGAAVNLADGPTRVVQVTLSGVLTALQGSSQPSFYSFSFRVGVRN